MDDVDQMEISRLKEEIEVMLGVIREQKKAMIEAPPPECVELFVRDDKRG